MSDMIWIFEKGDTDQEDLKRRWDYNQVPDAPIFVQKRDRYQTRTCRPIRPFEAADLVAYENMQANKLLLREGGEAYIDQVRAPMRRMAALSGADGWLFASENEIEMICSAWNIPKR
jgi:hypothetical protein